jgi:hypothetical protein
VDLRELAFKGLFAEHRNREAGAQAGARTLKTSQVDVKITYPRDIEKNAHCIGKPVPGFRVEYTSEPNYHGSDSFQIHVTFGKRTDIDNFSINVE